MYGARSRGLDTVKIHEFEAITGKGVAGLVGEARVVLGNSTLMQDREIDLSSLIDSVNAFRDEGKTAMFVAVEGKLVGLFAVADPIKATTRDAIFTLQMASLTVIMATGDNW